MQKVVGNKLYVFDLTPFEITEGTDKETIYVQFECLDGYKELNASIADKMQGFNQFLACVTKPEWAQENPGPTPDTYKLTLSGTIINYDCASIFINHEQVEKQEEYDLDEGIIVEIFPYNDSSYYTVVQGSDILNWDDGVESGNDPHWWMQMPAEDVAIEIDYSTEPQTVTNVLVVNSINGENPLGGDNIWDSTDAEWAKNLDYYEAGEEDDQFYITLAVDHDYNIFNATIESMICDGSTIGEQNDDHYDFTMPDGNVVECTVAEPQPLADSELAWSANSATVTIGANDNVFPTLINPNEINDGLTYESSNDTVADINNYGEIILVAAGNTTISAIFVGDETYSASTVSYDLTVESNSGPSGSSGESGQSGQSGQSGESQQ